MKKSIIFLGVGVLAALTLFGTIKANANSNSSQPYTPISYSALPDGNPVYRLYNPNTGEHFYTSSALEKTKLITLGWKDEKIGWYSPFANGKGVYRLYNPNVAGGDHYYTTSIFEKDSLTKQGWHYDGEFWQSGGNVQVNVAYNPNAKSGTHNFTTSAFEQNKLLTLGWKFPSVAWKAVQSGMLNEKKKALPAPLNGSDSISDNLSEALNYFQMKILQSGALPLGSKAVYFEDFGELAGNYQSGVYGPNSHVEFKWNNGNFDFDLKVSSIASSRFHSSQIADGGGRVVALLTTNGWYLLPDIKTMFGTEEKTPDLTKFIKTGNPSTLTSYIDGTDLVYNSTDQFGKAVFLGQ